jgi:GWxTD domain-containing protein
MSIRSRIFQIGVFATALLASLFGADATSLPKRYQTWLDEEVVYIITPVEKSVFLKLPSDRERDAFIEAFWKHRDPTPDSDKNEFRIEHDRRIAHAVKSLGLEAPVPGWKTDRGRFYIILGEPMEIERFQGKSQIYNCEAWFYQGKEELGLPPGFYLLFFQKSGVGAYKLYSPANDGPMALIAGYTDTGADYARSYEALKAVDDRLSSLSLSLIPGEQSAYAGRPSLVSDMLIQQIQAAPQKLVRDTYARKFLDYKDRVDVEYTANYLESDFLLKIVQDPSGVSFIHYSIEPQRLSVSEYQGKYYTTLALNGVVSTGDGKRVYQFDKKAAIEMTPAEMTERKSLPFDIHDLFPLVPGDYVFSVLLKNEVSREFTSFESPVHVPAAGTGVRMSSPLLAYQTLPVPAEPRRVMPFLLAGKQMLGQPGRVFLQKDTLFVAFQLLGLTGDLASKGTLRYAFAQDDQPFKEIVRRTAEYAALPDVVEPCPLSEFPPAHYRLRISFLADGLEKAFATDEFDVTPKGSMPRPWFYSKVLPGISDPMYSRLIGRQLMNLGRMAEAKAILEPLYGRTPNEDLAIELSRVYLALKEFDRIDPLLAPYLADEQTAKYESFVLAGRANQSVGRFARAVTLYEAAAARFGTSVILLNALGESYLGSGDKREALAAWEKSLSLSPDQPALRKRVDDLKSDRSS